MLLLLKKVQRLWQNLAHCTLWKILALHVGECLELHFGIAACAQIMSDCCEGSVQCSPFVSVSWAEKKRRAPAVAYSHNMQQPAVTALIQHRLP